MVVEPDSDTPEDASATDPEIVKKVAPGQAKRFRRRSIATGTASRETEAEETAFSIPKEVKPPGNRAPAALHPGGRDPEGRRGIRGNRESRPPCLDLPGEPRGRPGRLPDAFASPSPVCSETRSRSTSLLSGVASVPNR